MFIHTQERFRHLFLIDLRSSVYVSPLNSIDIYNRNLLEQYKLTLNKFIVSSLHNHKFNSITQAHLHYRTDLLTLHHIDVIARATLERNGSGRSLLPKLASNINP